MESMLQLVRSFLTLLLLLAVLAPVAGAADEVVQPVVAVDAARQELLAQQGFLAWQRINEARLNPRAALRRLGISKTQAREVLGDDAWIVDRGLPPLAWNAQLYAVVTAHGRDMFERLYYSHTTPEGLGPAQRIAAAGYQAVRADETLGALVFDSYVDVAMAVDFMVDTMLRDELTGTPGVKRNIFSPQLTEVGISFFAESLPLIEGNPYVYLFALDFAAPLTPVSYLVGVYDASTGERPMMMPFATGLWDFLPVLHPGYFQLPYPEAGAALVLVDEAQRTFSSQVFVNDMDELDLDHHLIDLRALQ